MSKGHDVVIVGSGPVGLTTALLLAQAGHSVALVDRHPSIYPLPRAIGFDHEIARILHQIGLTEAMAPLVATPGIYQWRDAGGALLFEHEWASEASISGFPASYVFSQPDMEDVLNRAALANPLVTMHRGVEIAGFTQDAEGIRVSGSDGQGRPFSLSGRWLIGADGANSLIRKLAGLDLEDLGFRADWLVVDVKPKPGATLPLDDNLMMQLCDPARPTSVVSGGPGRRRWEFMALAGETLADLNCEERAWQMLAPWHVTALNADLERHAVYTFRGAVAPQWRRGRVFIAGDAAHLTPPFAGQGLCAGFRDAAALAWRLDLALRGLATQALLDSYGTERRDHAHAWVVNAVELGKVICVLDPVAAAARDDSMKAARLAGAPPPSSGILPQLGPGLSLREHHGGVLALGARLAAGQAQGHVDDIIGHGFVLLSRLGDPRQALSAEAAALFDAIRGHAVDLSPSARVQDIEGAYARWLDGLDADVALIRPDFYLLGAARGEAAADELVLSLRPFVLASAPAAA